MIDDALAIDVGSFPPDKQARREMLELRAAPSDTRPQLSAVYEAELAETEEKTAQCYIQAEETTYRMLRLARRLKSK
jgi:hypothetical protein